MTRLSSKAAKKRGARQSRYKRRRNDAYDTTDPAAVAPLLRFLGAGTRFIEPCAGAGDLVQQLQAAGHLCAAAFDITPRADGIRQIDALSANWSAIDGEIIITNPPFSWPLLRDLILTFIGRAGMAWVLLEADFAHRKHSAGLLAHCAAIVSIGQIRWLPGSKHKSTKLYAWYLFTRETSVTRFYPDPNARIECPLCGAAAG